MSRPRRIANEVIYDAAHEIIMQQGLEKLTFQTLGSVTGLVPAALVKRFKSKRQLLVEVDAYYLEVSANTLAEAAKRFDSPLDAIMYGLSSEMKFATSANVYTNGLAFLLKGLNDPELYKNYQIAFQQQFIELQKLLEKAMIQGELRKNIDCAELARLLQITQQGACHIWIMSQEESIEKCIERHLKTLLMAYKPFSR